MQARKLFFKFDCGRGFYFNLSLSFPSLPPISILPLSAISHCSILFLLRYAWACICLSCRYHIGVFGLVDNLLRIV